MVNRRQFLAGLFVAPAIIKASSLMKIHVPERKIVIERVHPSVWHQNRLFTAVDDRTIEYTQVMDPASFSEEMTATEVLYRREQWLKHSSSMLNKKMQDLALQDLMIYGTSIVKVGLV